MFAVLPLLIALQTGGQGQGAPLSSLFRADDYPIEALKRDEQGTVGYALSIDSRGRPKSCRVVKSSGSTRLDVATCKILMKRARFRPARDSQGNPVEDVSTGEISWRFRY